MSSEEPAGSHDDGTLSSDLNVSPTHESKGTASPSNGCSSHSEPSRSSFLGHGLSSGNADSGMFSEQLQRLRTRLQSVVQGVREVAQSLDEPHSLITNVRDQLQYRQDATATACRSSGSLSASFTEARLVVNAAAAPAGTMAEPLARISGSSRAGGFSRSGDTTGSPFAVVASAAAPDAFTASTSVDATVLIPDVTGDVTSDSDLATIISVKAIVAEVERLSRSSGGSSEPLHLLPSSGPVSEELQMSIAGVEGALGGAEPQGSESWCSPQTAAGLAAATALQLPSSRSFGSGRKSLSPAATDSATWGSLPGKAPAGSPPSTRASSGTWPRVVIPPPVYAPSSYPSTLAAAVAAAPMLAARSHAAWNREDGTRMVASGGCVPDVLAADSIASDPTELLGSGDDTLLAATANPAAAAAYLREHPETLRELWTLRASVSSQENDLAAMTKQLSSKNAQLDQAQSSLQTKERELAAITQRLTGVLAKLSFQAAHGDHEHHQQHYQYNQHQHPYQQHQDQGSLQSGSVAGAADGPTSARSAWVPVEAAGKVVVEAPPPCPQGLSSAGGVAGDVAAAVALPLLSTPQTPLRSTAYAASSVPTSVSSFSSARAAMQAEAAHRVSVAGTSGGVQAPGNSVNTMPSTETSQSAFPEPLACVATVTSLGPQPAGLSLNMFIPLPLPGTGQDSAISRGVCVLKQAQDQEEQADLEAEGREAEMVSASTAAVSVPAGGDILPLIALDSTVERLETEAIPLSDTSVPRLQQQSLLQLQHEPHQQSVLKPLQQPFLHHAQQQPQPQQQSQPPQQPQQQRRREGLLRMLLLQLGPSVAAMALLLHDPSVQRRLQQWRSTRVDSKLHITLAQPPPPQPPLLLLPPSPPQGRHPQLLMPSLSSSRQQQQEGGRESLGRRVLKAVTARVAAAGVRPAGSHRRGGSRNRSALVTPDLALPRSPSLSPSPRFDAETNTELWSSQCKSMMCKIIRPPPLESIYY